MDLSDRLAAVGVGIGVGFVAEGAVSVFGMGPDGNVRNVIETGLYTAALYGIEKIEGPLLEQPFKDRAAYHAAGIMIGQTVGRLMMYGV